MCPSKLINSPTEAEVAPHTLSAATHAWNVDEKKNVSQRGRLGTFHCCIIFAARFFFYFALRTPTNFHSWYFFPLDSPLFSVVIIMLDLNCPFISAAAASTLSLLSNSISHSAVLRTSECMQKLSFLWQKAFISARWKPMNMYRVSYNIFGSSQTSVSGFDLNPLI